MWSPYLKKRRGVSLWSPHLRKQHDKQQQQMAFANGFRKWLSQMAFANGFRKWLSQSGRPQGYAPTKKYKMKDFNFDQNGDLDISGGDFNITESTAQHIKQLLFYEKGWIKAAPTVGAAIRDAINDESSRLELQGNIQDTLEADGLTILELDMSQKINVIAVYK